MPYGNTPTHIVTQRSSGLDVAIYIAPSLMDKLESPDIHTRSNARKSVCISFRMACQQKYPRFNQSYVEWQELELTPIPAGAHSSPMNPDGDECDECTMCDRGDHHLCRQSCPIAAGWYS